MGKLGQLADCATFSWPLSHCRNPLPTYAAVMHARESRMTPQERQLVDELFDRLAGLENNPRDPDAERVIADGVRRAPHAVYALVQTALVMDEALKRANARIEELQAQVGGEGATAIGRLPRQHARRRCSDGATRAARCRRCARKRNLHPYRRPISHRPDIPHRRRPILRVRAWARPLGRADRFSARPHRQQRG